MTISALAGAAAIDCAAHPLDAVVLQLGPDGGVGPTVDASVDGGAVLIWPNFVSQHNSDPWIATNHDQIVQMQPKVLVLDFANRFQPESGPVVAAGYDLQQTVVPLVQKHIDAFATASRYRGYKSQSAPAPPFLVYQLAKIVDLRDNGPDVNSAKLPKSNNGSVDYAQLNTTAFADMIGIPDPDHPGTNLSLCGLFEKGVINEVWGMAADPITTSDPQSIKFAEYTETKQAYTLGNQPIAQQLVCTSPTCIDQALPCGVTTRLYDFNPGRGAGCHMFVTGLVWEGYLVGGVLPAFARVARTFFNFDFDQRFGATFSNFYQSCPPAPIDAGPCILWRSSTRAVAGPASTRTFDFSPMSAGCGNVGFPPNATGAALQDDTLTVMTSCENYGLQNGPDGSDLTTPYTMSLPTSDYAGIAGAASPDCAGPQVTYMFASMPGLGTTATAPDGTPMKNWWPYLFY
jgi:hypothetical protein